MTKNRCDHAQSNLDLSTGRARCLLCGECWYPIIPKQDPHYGLGSGHNSSGLANACEQDEGA